MTTPIFCSALADDIGSYIDLKCSLGLKAQTIEKNLRLLDRFLASRHPDARDLSLPILEAWLGNSPNLKPSTRAMRLRVVRQFCLYRLRTQPGVYVLEKQNAWKIWPRQVPRYMPHIFSAEEVTRMLRTALELQPSARNPYRPRTFFTLLLLLYVTGLRISEAHALRISDVDWSDGTLLIRKSKFFKTRVVPVKADMLSVLREYQRLLKLPKRTASIDLPFFQRGQGSGYCQRRLQAIAIQVLRSAGLKPGPGKGGPHLHDLRHTFAVRCIERWYAQGRDVQNLLPRLATYMGHGSFNATQYYVTITATILEHAGQRFERSCAPGRQV